MSGFLFCFWYIKANVLYILLFYYFYVPQRNVIIAFIYTNEERGEKLRRKKKWSMLIKKIVLEFQGI